jgi:ELWxxDGT repeat protein
MGWGEYRHRHGLPPRRGPVGGSERRITRARHQPERRVLPTFPHEHRRDALLWRRRRHPRRRALALGRHRGGTTLVRDINPSATSTGGAGPSPRFLRNLGGTLLFRANDGTHGYELWRSDGTAAGTTLVRDINPSRSPRDSVPEFLRNVGGTLFFSADDGTHGYELWRSDGTAAGTRLVRDIYPGDGSSFASRVTNVGGTLLFGAVDGTHGYELWRSDGTAAGTKLVRDINPGDGNSSPRNFRNVGATLFFGADDGTNGRELWKAAP